jgi:hypothetical protein
MKVNLRYIESLYLIHGQFQLNNFVKKKLKKNRKQKTKNYF